MNAQRLLKARETAPNPGLLFNVWFLPLLLEALEPMQSAMLIWMLERGGRVRSDDLTAHFDTTPQRAGSVISDLRKLGLVTSTPIVGEPTRASWHRVTGWVLGAWIR